MSSQQEQIEIDALLVSEDCTREEFEADEALWDAQFAASQDFIAFLAQEAVDDYRAGRTEPLDADTL